MVGELERMIRHKDPVSPEDASAELHFRGLGYRIDIETLIFFFPVLRIEPQTLTCGSDLGLGLVPRSLKLGERMAG